MKKRIWTGVLTGVVGFATAAAISAQTAAPQQSAAGSGDRRITVTGCLSEAPSTAATAAGAAAATTGTTAATGTTGTTGTAAAAGTTGTTGETAAPKFVLTNATATAAAPAAGAASTTEAPANSAASAPAAQTYRLIANSAALSPHVGKKLELTGTLEDPNAATGASETSGSAEFKAVALRVESGKVVAASCSQ